MSRKYFYWLLDLMSRWDIEYYWDFVYRGYLSYMLKIGELFSLYFKVFGEKVFVGKKLKKLVDVSEERFF